jgi:type I restriction enzyme S subunit
LSRWQLPMSNWPKVPLGRVANVRSGFPFSSRDWIADGIPVVKISNVKDGRLDLASCDYVAPEVARATELMLCPGDILISMTGYIGDTAWVRESDLPAVVNQRVGIFSLAEPHAIERRFLFYVLRSDEVRSEFERRGYGSAQPNISPSLIQTVAIPLPPLAEQRAIAEVLGALDDKIEANRRVAKRSRQLAIAEGVHRLTTSPGRVAALEQVAHIAKGLSYRSDDLVPGGGWLVSLKCVGRDGSFQSDGLKPFSGSAKSAQVVEEGDILVAQTDLTQRAEVIGRPIRVERLDFVGAFTASLDFVIVRPRGEMTNEVLLAVLSQQEFRDHALAHCNGTTVLHMNSRALPSFELLVPSPDVIAEVTAIMHPLLTRSDVARRESRLLVQLRDALLPKLLSGELRVRDAESIVGEAV